MTSDEELHEFDLTAWEAPPPPADLADAVIARMLGTQVVPIAAPARRRWLVPALAASVLAPRTRASDSCM